MGTIIAFANQKGGVGKTTSTLNIAAAMGSAGKKVAVVDLDPQGHLTRSMGLVPDELENTIADAFAASIRMDPFDAEYVNELMVREKGVDLLPVDISLSGIDMAIVNATSREYILAEILSMIRNSYDYILIDCLPSLGSLAINAFTAANYIVVPVKAQYLGLNGFSLLKSSLDVVKIKTNKKLRTLGVFLTMYDARLNEAKETLSDAARICAENDITLFPTKISAGTDAATASRKGKTIFEYKPGCKIANEYSHLADQINESINQSCRPR